MAKVQATSSTTKQLEYVSTPAIPITDQQTLWLIRRLLFSHPQVAVQLGIMC